MRPPAPRPVALLLSCALLLAGAAPAAADQHGGEPAAAVPEEPAATFRPASLIFLLISPVCFALAAPFAAIGGGEAVGKLAERFFVQPLRYAFVRDAMAGDGDS